MVTIELDPFARPVVSWFVTRYLFNKAMEEGGRTKGDDYVANMHRQWQQFRTTMGKSSGDINSFRREIRSMKARGVIENTREEKIEGNSMPRRYYALAADYFDALKEESKTKR